MKNWYAWQLRATQKVCNMQTITRVKAIAYQY